MSEGAVKKVLIGAVLATGGVAGALYVENGNLESELRAMKIAVRVDGADQFEDVTASKSVENMGELAELRRKLLAKENQISSLQSKLKQRAKVVPNGNYERGKRPQGRGDWMEKLREKDPERYEKIKVGIAKMTESMWSSVDAQELFFSELDTSGMTDEQLAKHTTLLEKLHSVKDNNMDKKGYYQLFGKVREMDDLFKSERNYILEQYGRDLGYEDGTEFSGYINDVNKLTSGRGYFENMKGLFGKKGRH